jgi:hypothetical protein
MEILVNIKPGQKLSFKGGKVEIVDNPSRLSRWLSGENKHTTLKGVRDVIESEMSKGTPMGQQVIKALENLKVTYRSSKTMTTELTELQNRIHEYYYNGR